MVIGRRTILTRIVPLLLIGGLIVLIGFTYMQPSDNDEALVRSSIEKALSIVHAKDWDDLKPLCTDEQELEKELGIVRQMSGLIVFDDEATIESVSVTGLEATVRVHVPMTILALGGRQDQDLTVVLEKHNKVWLINVAATRQASRDR